MIGKFLSGRVGASKVVKSAVSSYHSQRVPGKEEAALPVCGRHHPGQGKGE